MTGPSEAQNVQTGEISGKEVDLNPWRFSVAPMMDGTSGAQKAWNYNC